MAHTPKFKKVIAMVLFIAMVSSLFGGAFATGEDAGEDGQVVVTGEPVIDVGASEAPEILDEVGAPVEEPETPAEEPETPAEEPETPAEEPETPADETPAEEHGTSGVIGEEPVVGEPEIVEEPVVEAVPEVVFEQQTLSYGDVSVSGVLPKGAYIEAYEVEIELEGYEVLVAYDITVYNADGTVFDASGIELAVSISAPAIAEAEEVEVLHMEDAAAPAESVETVATPGETVSFGTAEGFSIYVVVNNTSTKAESKDEAYTIEVGESVNLVNRKGDDDSSKIKGNWAIESGSDFVGFTSGTNSTKTITVKALKAGSAVVKCTYSDGGQKTNYFHVTVEAAQPKMIPVAVYATDGTDEGSKSFNSDIRSLLGIGYVQDDSYAPIGVIYLPDTLFAGNSPYIHTSEDWATVRAAIGSIDLSCFNGYGKNNAENTVSSNLGKVQFDSSAVADSKKTALFDWNMPEHFDATHGITLANPEGGNFKYHLDLRFSTKTLKYVGVKYTNGIPENVTVDLGTRTFLKDTNVTRPGSSADFYLNTDQTAGYAITGYYTTNACVAPEYSGFGSPLTVDTTVYVKLEKSTVTVTYDLNGGTAASEASLQYPNLSVGVATPTIPNPTRAGFVFDGWNPTVENYVTESVTYVARWTPETTTFTGTKAWANNDGNYPANSTLSLTISANETPLNPQPTPTWDGNTFTYSDLNKYNSDVELITYTVAETAVDSYSTSYGEGNTSCANGGTITNTYVPPVTTGTLTVTKTVTGLPSIEGYAVSITVNGKTESVTLTESNGTYTGSVEFTDLPAASYDVTETVTGVPNDYALADSSTTSTSAQVTAGGSVSAALTNNYAVKTGSLKITKALAADSENVTIPAGTTFSVYKTGSSTAAYTFSYADMENGEYVIPNVPVGSYYVVESGYAVAAYDCAVSGAYTAQNDQNAATSVAGGTTATIAVTNKYTKHFGVDIVSDATFTIHKQDEAGKAMAVAFTLENAGGTTVWSGTTDATTGNASVTIDKQYLGTERIYEFTLTETVPAGYAAAGPWAVTVTRDGAVTVQEPSKANGNVFHNIWNWIVTAVTGTPAGSNLIDNAGVLTVTNTKATALPVRFYLETVKNGNSDLANYFFTDDYAKLKTVSSYAWLETTLSGKDNAVYDAITTGIGLDYLTEQSAIKSWLSSADANITIDDIVDLIGTNGITGDTTVNGIKLSDIKADPTGYSVVYAALQKNLDHINSWISGNLQDNGQRSFHVHITVVKNAPTTGTLTINKTATINGVADTTGGYSVSVYDAADIENGAPKANAKAVWIVSLTAGGDAQSRTLPGGSYYIIETGADKANYALTATGTGSVTVTNGSTTKQTVNNAYAPISYEYVIHHLEKGTKSPQLAPDTNGRADFGATIDVSTKAVTIDGYAYDSETGDITITNGTNEATIYYTKQFGPDVNNYPDLTINKVDENGKVITTGEATFTLTKSGETGVDYTTKSSTVTIEDIKPGTYTLVEKTAPAGYDKSNSEWKIEVTQDGKVTVTGPKDGVFTKVYNWIISALTGDKEDGKEDYAYADGTLTVENTKITGTATVGASVSFQKTDGSNALAGAKFELSKDGAVKYEATSIDNGSVTFSDIKETGVYTLTERSAPEGYDKADGILAYVKVTSSDEETLKDGKFVTTTTYTAAIYSDAECTTPVADFTVVNDKLYTVTYRVEGTVPAGAPTAPTDADSPYVAGATVTQKDTLTFKGYTFTGWSSNEVETVNASKQFEMPAQDVVFKGSWVANTHDITYTVISTENPADYAAAAVAALGEKGVGFGTAEAVKAVLTTTAKTDKDGVPGTWTFTGWNLKTPADLSINAETKAYSMPDSNVEFEGEWSFTPDGQYTVIYQGNGGVTADTEPLTSVSENHYDSEGYTVKDSMFSRTDYQFTGWTVDKEVSTTPGDAVDKQASKTVITYTAQWTRDTGLLTVKKEFNANVFTPASVTFTVTGPDDYSETVTLNEGNYWTWSETVPTGVYTVVETANGATGYYTCTTTYSGANGEVTVVKANSDQTPHSAPLDGLDDGVLVITNTYTYNPPYYPPDPATTPTTPPATDIPETDPPTTEAPQPSPSEEIDIPEESTPLAPGPDDGIDIPDDDVPKDDSPKTGDSFRDILLWIIVVVCALGITVLGLDAGRRNRKSRRDRG